MAPAIRGTLLQDGVPLRGGEVRRSFRSCDVPTLGGAEWSQVGEDGSFRFDRVSLAIAGREFAKEYFVSLCLRTGDGTRPLWHDEYDRRTGPAEVVLRCELSAAARDPAGLPCHRAD